MLAETQTLVDFKKKPRPAKGRPPKSEQAIPVIDLFAGPGGLGEGFSAFYLENSCDFQVRLSVEKDFDAFQTLRLRTFFRQFPPGHAPHEYYSVLRGEL